jgi:sulfotransferase family protein
MSLIQALRRKSALYRKSTTFPMQVSRAARRIMATEDAFRAAPPLIANSFPKSGTHLLTQILEAFPGARSYGTVWASVPGLPHRERPKSAMLRRIHRAAPGEVVQAHLHYESEYPSAMASRNAAHFFIYRDLRDVVVSEAHYLTDMNRWHSLHKHFRKLASLEERVAFAITGSSDPDFPYDYPDVGTRFRRSRPWLDRDDVFAVRFEDLVSEQRDEKIHEMVRFCTERFGLSWDISEVARNAIANIAPSRSRTFRKGKAGEWKKTFSPRHVELLKKSAGDLLIDLGYERDMDW